jgi:hypothetical protein
MAISTVGLWIDQSRAVIVFPRSLTAHLVESGPKAPSRYYDEVIAVLGPPGPVVIMGPGTAKDELRQRMAHAQRRRELREWVVEVEPTESMSTNEIVAALSTRLQDRLED